MAKVEISKESCKSCGYCVKYCPKNVLEIGKEVNRKGYQFAAVVNADDCIGCKMCANICPDAAIEIYK